MNEILSADEAVNPDKAHELLALNLFLKQRWHLVFNQDILQRAIRQRFERLHRYTAKLGAADEQEEESEADSSSPSWQIYKTAWELNFLFREL